MSTTDPRHAMVEVVGVEKMYGVGEGAAAALRGVDFQLRAGEFVSLMGPSGSGKSTLLNVIAGLDVPTRGRVAIEGRELATMKDHELADMRLQKLGFVFQAFNLLPALTVDENVAWPLKFSGYPRTAIRMRVGEALERTGVGGRGTRYPAELSGGEQQRVAIARAIVTRPKLLLADEPTGNLDSQTGRAVLDLLREMNDSEGMSILMVTHNVFAASYGHRTLEMRDGRVVRTMLAPARAGEVEGEAGEG